MQVSHLFIKVQISPEIKSAEVQIEGAEERHEGEDVPLAKRVGAAARQPFRDHISMSLDSSPPTL